MKRSLIVLVCLLGLIISLHAQNVGDQATAGGTDSRTHFNANAGRVSPPFAHSRTLTLPEGADPTSLTVFEQAVLVGSSGNPGTYWLLNKETGAVRWSRTVPTAQELHYTPAAGDDIVLLGGSTTTTVNAVQVSTGASLWSDDRFGSSSGRSPLLTSGLALYHGQNGLAAADPADGTLFWRFPATSEQDSVSPGEAPAALYGSRVYLAGQPSGLYAVNLLNGGLEWAVPTVGANGANVLATQKLVFVADPVLNRLTALRTSDGSVVWSLDAAGPLGSPAIALAYDQLVVFSSRDEQAVVTALQPENGNLIWEAVDPSEEPGVPQFGSVADNAVFFYNSGSGRLRVLDAFTGTLTWSRQLDEVRGLSVVSGELYVLLEASLEVYAPVFETYLPQIADGEGATTLISVVNLSPVVNTGTVEFLDNDGAPLPIEVEGQAGPVTSVNFSLQPNGAAKIQTAGTSPQVVSGWARLKGIRALAGTAVFQYSEQGVILFEAGVGDAPAAGEANFFVTRIGPSELSLISTGVAFANPSDETANVAIQFRRRVPSLATFDAEITLPPGEHLAEFVEEIFPDDALAGTEGYLIIRSDIPIAITVLRTQNGYQMSSYPVGIPGR